MLFCVHFSPILLEREKLSAERFSSSLYTVPKSVSVAGITRNIRYYYRTYEVKKNSISLYCIFGHAAEYNGYSHRNQTISRKGAYIISRRPSHGHLARRCCPQAFLRIFSEVTYIRTVGNSTLLKIYTLPNHTITIGECILDTQLLDLLYGGSASFVQKWFMPWMSANILYSIL
jgi:hypothetical protein